MSCYGNQSGVRACACACACTYRHQSVSFSQLATEVSRSSGEDEGYEDALAVLPAHDVEAQPCGSSVQNHLPGLPAGGGTQAVSRPSSCDAFWCLRAHRVASTSSCALWGGGEKPPEDGGGGRGWLKKLEGLIWFSVF